MEPCNTLTQCAASVGNTPFESPTETTESFSPCLEIHCSTMKGEQLESSVRSDTETIKAPNTKACLAISGLNLAGQESLYRAAMNSSRLGGYVMCQE